GPKSFYDPAVCMAAVLVGSKPYQEGLRQIVDRNGSDGTVYVCTSNLNASGLTLRFGRANEDTRVDEWPCSAKPVAFGVFGDRDHETITRPDQGKRNFGSLILEFLRLASAEEYQAYTQRCAELTAQTLPPKADRKIFHTYQNLAARVVDDLGFPVKDYFLEFYEKPAKTADELKIDKLMIKIHREVLEDVHTYGPDPSYRSLLFDLSDLRKTLGSSKRLMFSLSAAPLGPLVSFSAGANNDVSELALTGAQAKSFWRDNQTLVADLVIQRLQAEKVFQLQQ
ncbi:MAG TPA: hypothetical protein VHF69_02500, partial [Candidatus Synoicihabitans sp.]|nr:hypothetical protein [Candidatus Synoicihabitans sp.]